MIQSIIIGCLAVVVLAVEGNAQPPDTVGNIIWYPPIQLSDDTINSCCAQIAVSGDDTVHVTWKTDSQNQTIMKLPYVKIISGKVVDYRDLLQDNPAFPFFVAYPVIIARNNLVWIFFTQPTSDQDPLYIITSLDGGNSWDLPVAITEEVADRVYSPSEAMPTIAVLYPHNLPLRILHSTDNGTTWIRSSNNLDDHRARIALTEGSLHLVQHTWLPPSSEIEYRRSSDLGDTWEIDTVISDVDGYWSDLPTIAGYTSECGTELLTAWRDGKYGWFGILGASIISRAGLENGTLWLSENVLTAEPKGFAPTADIRGGVRAVGWGKEVAAADTFHGEVTATNYSLRAYSFPFDLTPGVEVAGVDDIAVSSHAVHVVWHEAKVANGSFRIYYRRGEFIQKDVSFSLSTGLLTTDAIEINTTASDTVYVMNSGTDTLVIGTIISTDENFAVSPPETTVAPGGSTAVEIRITPKSLGEHSGKIIFYHNGQTSPDCISVTTVGKWRQESVAYQSGWNLVSIPMLPGPAQNLPSLFAYENGYVRRDTMMAGTGYWAKLPSDSTVTYRGVAVWSDTFEVKARWNMIGSLTAPVAVSSIQTIPDSLIVSGFYGYNAKGYVTVDTLSPGKAYWVKARENGALIVTATQGIRNMVQVRVSAYGSVGGFTTLKVYDIFGREVAMLVNEKLQPGEHEVEWNAERFSSGIYFYRIVQENRTLVGKAVLIK
jgi:hypothetical protein